MGFVFVKRERVRDLLCESWDEDTVVDTDAESVADIHPDTEPDTVDERDRVTKELVLSSDPVTVLDTSSVSEAVIVFEGLPDLLRVAFL